MNETIFEPLSSSGPEALKTLLGRLDLPYKPGARVGIKLHWGERGNLTYLSPDYARQVASFLTERGFVPLVIDTTVLYSGGRRNGADSLATAARHGYVEEYLGCPVAIADGLDGLNTLEIPAGYKHFEQVQVARAVCDLDGFFILSHFKGHLAAGFGGAIKNISMGLAARAQKQRMHADARPRLSKKRCRRCGLCIDVCPVSAGSMIGDDYPVYDHARCVGCAQCIALCPEAALKVVWETDSLVFQEKLVETAAAIWKIIATRTIAVNLLLNVTINCDCMSGHHPVIAPDTGVVGGYHPLAVDEKSLQILGENVFDRAHPDIPWRRQFSYAREIGFI